MKLDNSFFPSAHRTRCVLPGNDGCSILIHLYPARSHEKKKRRSITWPIVPSSWLGSLGNSSRERLQSSKGFNAADRAQNIDPEGKSIRPSGDIFTPILRASFCALLKFQPHPIAGQTAAKCCGAIIPSLGSTLNDSKMLSTICSEPSNVSRR